MTTKLKWIRDSNTSRQKWHAESHNLELIVWASITGGGWYARVLWTMNDDVIDLIIHENLLQYNPDPVEAMKLCERRAREVLMAEFGELIR